MRAPSSGDRRLPRHSLTTLFAIGAVVTLLVVPGRGTPVSDTPVRVGVAHWLLTGAPPFDGLRTPEPVALRDRYGVPTPWYGIGHSLALVPGDALATAAGVSSPRERFLVVQYLTFPIINGAVVAASGALLAALGFAATAACAGALSLALGSTLLWHFQNNQENPLQFLMVLLALIAALRWIEDRRPRWLVAMGASLGFNLLIRLPNIVDVALVSVLPMLLSVSRREYAAAWIRFAFPGLAAAVAIDRSYHFARFGEWTSNYMQIWGETVGNSGAAVPAGFPFSNDALTGLAGPFVSLQKSVFLFDPLLAVTIAVLVGSRHRMRVPVKWIACAAAAGMILVTAGYARYYNWGGTSGWGNRFLTTWLWVGCLLAVPLLMELNVRRRLIAGIAVVALCLQLSSIVFPSWLEEEQLDVDDTAVAGVIAIPDGRFDHFIIGQRVRNIADTARGAATFHPPIVPVLMPLEALPWWAALLARLAWVAAAAWVVAAGTRLVRR